MTTAEQLLPPPVNDLGEIDYSKDPGLDRYREGDGRRGLDQATIELAVVPINESARTATITRFHGALAINAVSRVYVAELGGSPSTVNRPAEPERTVETQRTRGPIAMARNMWIQIAKRRA